MSKKPDSEVNQVKTRTPKIGDGHAGAMFRQGFSELRGALYTDSNVAQPTEYGMYATKLPSEIAEERRGAPEQGPTLEQHVKRATAKVARGFEKTAERLGNAMELDRE